MLQSSCGKEGWGRKKKVWEIILWTPRSVKKSGKEVLEELKVLLALSCDSAAAFGRTHIGTVCERLHPLGRTHTGAGEQCEGAGERSCYGLTSTLIPHPPVPHTWEEVEESGMKEGRWAWEEGRGVGTVFQFLSLFFTIQLYFDWQ